MLRADDESERLEALRATGLLHSGAEPAFARFARLAARQLGVQRASVSLVDDDRQVFKSPFGLDVGEVPLSHSLSRHVVAADAPVCVADLREDPRTAGSPAIEALGVLAFLGVPVRDRAGHVLGALSVVEAVPRAWTSEDVGALTDIAATVETELRLRTETADARRHRAIAASVVDNALDAIFTMGPDGITEDLNPAAVELFGYTREQAIGRPLSELIIPPALRGAHASGLARLRSGREGHILDRRIAVTAMRADGSELPVELAVTRAQADGACHYIGFVRDLRGVREAERARDAAEQQVAVIVEAAPMALFAFDVHGIITLSVGSALEKLGHSSHQLVGRSALELYADRPDVLDALRRALAGERFTTLNDEDGTIFETAFRPLLAPDGSFAGTVGVSLDVTERREADMRIQELAYRDQLTGLGNRASLAETAGRALARCRDAGHTAALLCIDLDEFRTVNESLGQRVGDRVLREAATRLGACVGEHGVLARPGADEFVLLVTDLGPGPEPIAKALGRRLLKVLETPHVDGGLEFTVRASIGISLFPRHGEYFDELMRYADVAMSRAKRSGHGRCAIYRPADEGARRRLTLTARLRRALVREEFVLHYQPLFELATGRLTAVEALLRWEDREGRLIGPLEFIGAAEVSGLIVEIGAWVAEAACRQAVDWLTLGHPIGVGFNVSPRQLADGRFAGMLAAVLERTGVDPGRMVVEVTESAAMGGSDEVTEELREVTDLGVRIVVDDFGAGHSSLTRLRRLPVQSLKMDRALLHGYPGDPAARAVVGATIALAEALEMTTVAEGVEHEAQVAPLVALGCTYAQGFGLARPMPAAAITALLERGATARTAAP